MNVLKEKVERKIASSAEKVKDLVVVEKKTGAEIKEIMVTNLFIEST